MNRIKKYESTDYLDKNCEPISRDKVAAEIERLSIRNVLESAIAKMDHWMQAAPNKRHIVTFPDSNGKETFLAVVVDGGGMNRDFFGILAKGDWTEGDRLETLQKYSEGAVSFLYDSDDSDEECLCDNCRQRLERQGPAQ
jgi:hypothetical protein